MCCLPSSSDPSSCLALARPNGTDAKMVAPSGTRSRREADGKSSAHNADVEPTSPSLQQLTSEPSPALVELVRLMARHSAREHFATRCKSHPKER